MVSAAVPAELATEVSAEEVERAIEGLTVAGLLRRNAERFADLPAVTSGIGPDAQTLTWSGLRAEVAAMTHGLAELGLGTGDRMIIMAATRPEHWIVDFGAMTLGAVPCTAYATLSTEQIRFIARQSGAGVVVLEGEDQLTRWLPALEYLPGVRTVIVLEPDALELVPEGDDRFVSYADVLESGRAAHRADPSIVEQHTDARTPEEPLCMLYTSGTTGDPKGVVISHRNAMWESAAAEMLEPLDVEHPRYISYLPLAHIAERVLSFYLVTFRVGHVTVCPDPTQLLPTLVAVRPHALFGVPRVWEKLATGLGARLAALPEEQRTAIDGARAVATDVFHRQAAGEEVPAELAARFAAVDEQVLRPIRSMLGLGEAQRLNSGAAALPVATQEFLAGLGLRIMEVWGLSETTGAATACRSYAFAPGAVGPGMPGLEVSIAEDGEILVRGPVVFAGYLSDDGEVVSALDADGWFATGDIGEVDERGLLRITDRKKELIVTSGGKNVAPSRVEGLLRGHPLIGQAAVIGDDRPYITALLVLDDESAPGWAVANGVPEDAAHDLATLAEQPVVADALAAAVTAANADLSRAEQVKRYEVLGVPWTAESGELTPTLKLRRRVITERYAEQIAALYDRPRD